MVEDDRQSFGTESSYGIHSHLQIIKAISLALFKTVLVYKWKLYPSKCFRSVRDNFARCSIAYLWSYTLDSKAGGSWASVLPKLHSKIVSTPNPKPSIVDLCWCCRWMFVDKTLLKILRQSLCITQAGLALLILVPPSQVMWWQAGFAFMPSSPFEDRCLADLCCVVWFALVSVVKVLYKFQYFAQ